MTDEKDPAASYAGRWVARLRGRIIAQGGTPELARRTAKSSRHKESPEIIFMPAPFSIPDLIKVVVQALPADQQIHLVGGAVRDLFLGRTSHDFDFAVPADGVELARRVANALRADFNALDGDRDIGRVIVTTSDGTRTLLDFAKYKGGTTIEADLNGRDLTVNAIAYDLRAETILDPLDGVADLRLKSLRACTPTAFLDDPVRVLRTIRLAADLGFKIEPRTRALMKQAAEGLANVSPERLRDEMFKLFESPNSADSVRALELLGALPHVFPELTLLKDVQQPAPHVYDVWTHTLTLLKHLESILMALAPIDGSVDANDPFVEQLTQKIGRFRPQITDHYSNKLNPDRSVRGLIIFAGLYHDVSKPETRSLDETGRIRFFDHDQQGTQVVAHRAQAFRLSNDELERLRLIVANHMRIHFHISRMEADQTRPSRKAIYRFFRDSGEAGVDLVLLGLADLRAIRGPELSSATWAAAVDVAALLLENYWEKPHETVAPPRLLDGNDLMNELDLDPGPVVGKVLEAIREAQATGEVTTREQGLDLARAWLKANPS